MKKRIEGSRLSRESSDVAVYSATKDREANVSPVHNPRPIDDKAYRLREVFQKPQKLLEHQKDWTDLFRANE